MFPWGLWRMLFKRQGLCHESGGVEKWSERVIEGERKEGATIKEGEEIGVGEDKCR